MAPLQTFAMGKCSLRRESARRDGEAKEPADLPGGATTFTQTNLRAQRIQCNFNGCFTDRLRCVDGDYVQDSLLCQTYVCEGSV